MVKKIITVPDSLLRKKAKPVTKIDKKVKKLVNDLIKSAEAAKEPEGVGLSAIQIGELKRIFIIKRGSKFEVFLNPKITWKSKKKFSQVLEKEKRFLEGCLSVPGYYAFVDRPYKVKLQWQDLKGKPHQEKFKDKQSAYVQHEFDHLNGILFVDRALKQGEKIYQLKKNNEGKEELKEVKF